MKVNLKNRLQEIIDSYKADTVLFETNFRNSLVQLNDPDVQRRYTESGFHELTTEKIAEITGDWKAVCTTYNQKAKAVVEDAKESIMAAVMGTPTRPADYSTRIANALNFLDRETADSLTDDVAFSILKDFVGDFEQMGLFKRVIERKTGPGVVGTDFPKTFGAYTKAEMLNQSFDEIGAIVDSIFIHPKTSGGGSSGEGPVQVGNTFFEIPVDGYTEMANWATALDLAGSVDRLDPSPSSD